MINLYSQGIMAAHWMPYIGYQSVSQSVQLVVFRWLLGFSCRQLPRNCSGFTAYQLTLCNHHSLRQAMLAWMVRIMVLKLLGICAWISYQVHWSANEPALNY